LQDAETLVHVAAVARRLREIRQALGWSQSQLCRHTGIKPQVWNNAETGDNLLSVANAIKLYEKTGVHLHWIYCGGFTIDLPQTAKDALLANTPPARPKRKHHTTRR
jgi:transcriptional regulator with XRE-family HTH domain